MYFDMVFLYCALKKITYWSKDRLLISNLNTTVVFLMQKSKANQGYYTVTILANLFETIV